VSLKEGGEGGKGRAKAQLGFWSKANLVEGEYVGKTKNKLGETSGQNEAQRKSEAGVWVGMIKPGTEKKALVQPGANTLPRQNRVPQSGDHGINCRKENGGPGEQNGKFGGKRYVRKVKHRDEQTH